VQHLSAGGSLAGFSSSSPARQLASVQSAPASVGSAAIPSVLQPFNSSGSSSLQHLGLSHSSRTGLSSAAAAAADALTAGQLLALCGAVVDENAALAAAGVQPILLASLCLVESGGCAHAKQYRDHLGDVALGLCQVGFLRHACFAGSGATHAVHNVRSCSTGCGNGQKTGEALVIDM
jgi:hypothetical protein